MTEDSGRLASRDISGATVCSSRELKPESTQLMGQCNSRCFTSYFRHTGTYLSVQQTSPLWKTRSYHYRKAVPPTPGNMTVTTNLTYHVCRPRISASAISKFANLPQDAVEKLNSTQSGFKVLEERRRLGQKLNSDNVEQMRQWVRRIGHDVSHIIPLME